MERCYADITAEGDSVVVPSGEFADIVVDVSTCILLRDVTVLDDSVSSQALALSVSSLAVSFTRCCVVLTTLQTASADHR